MKIVKNAVAGTLESSDAYVQVEPNEAGIEIVLESVVLTQFGDDIKASVMEVLAENEVTNSKVSVNDRGTID
ncbi:MAG: citrate lyase acyl carrier protein [Oscillospiraceae bacterium]|nr:citrate lyase acyl carrier protein [Oscillospiraceae bacterium]